MPMENSERYWRAAAKSLARRINLGWWLDTWTGWLMVLTLVGAVAVLLSRWGGWFELNYVWYGLAGLLTLGAVVAWWMASSRFESTQTTLIRLEDSLQMKTRLSAAASGVGDWPQPRETIAWPVKWRWQRPAGIAAFGATMLLLANWIPISKKADDDKRVIEKPSAVKDVEQWMAEVRKEQAVQEESIQEVEEKISEMLKRPAENWYEHGSLEAAGNLKEQTADMLRELSQNLEDAERAANSLQAAGSTLPEATKEALTKQLLEAANELSTSGLKPDEKLLEQLKKMAGGQMQNNLNKEQLQQLNEQLKNNAQALQEALKNMPTLTMIPGTGKGEGEGKEPGPGEGGIDRGPGSAPLTLKSEETNLNTKTIDGLNTSLDVQRMAPGDLVGTMDGEHDVDPNAVTVPQQGGAIDNTGDGGAAVWQNSLLPEERESLRRYFK